MPYATQANLETRFGSEELAQLTDRANGAAIDAAVVTRALSDAEAEINGYLAGRYALPLVDVPPLLERVACDIARYYLYDDRYTEAVRTRYEDALRTLKEIAAGTRQLAVSAGPAPTSDTGGIAVKAPARVFDGQALTGY